MRTAIDIVVVELADHRPYYVDSCSTIQTSLGLAIDKLDKYLEELDQSIAVMDRSDTQSIT
jgi:hypothetical protein